MESYWHIVSSPCSQIRSTHLICNIMSIHITSCLWLHLLAMDNLGACGRLVLPLWYWLAGITGVSKLFGVALRVTYFYPIRPSFNAHFKCCGVCYWVLLRGGVAQSPW